MFSILYMIFVSYLLFIIIVFITLPWTIVGIIYPRAASFKSGFISKRLDIFKYGSILNITLILVLFISIIYEGNYDTHVNPPLEAIVEDTHVNPPLEAIVEEPNLGISLEDLKYGLNKQIEFNKPVGVNLIQDVKIIKNNGLNVFEIIITKDISIICTMTDQNIITSIAIAMPLDSLDGVTDSAINSSIVIYAVMKNLSPNNQNQMVNALDSNFKKSFKSKNNANAKAYSKNVGKIKISSLINPLIGVFVTFDPV